MLEKRNISTVHLTFTIYKHCLLAFKIKVVKLIVDFSFPMNFLNYPNLSTQKSLMAVVNSIFTFSMQVVPAAVGYTKDQSRGGIKGRTTGSWSEKKHNRGTSPRTP